MSTRTEYRDLLINTLVEIADALAQIKKLQEALEWIVWNENDPMFRAPTPEQYANARRALNETK